MINEFNSSQEFLIQLNYFFKSLGWIGSMQFSIYLTKYMPTYQNELGTLLLVLSVFILYSLLLSAFFHIRGRHSGLEFRVRDLTGLFAVGCHSCRQPPYRAKCTTCIMYILLILVLVYVCISHMRITVATTKLHWIAICGSLWVLGSILVNCSPIQFFLNSICGLIHWLVWFDSIQRGP